MADVIRASGHEIELLDATQGELKRAEDADLLIILGGPISVNDEPRFPFLSEECLLIEHRLAHGRATLGVCLGAQLIAKVLGARVYPMGYKEIGFSPLELTEAGAKHPLSEITTPVLCWHGEMFDLPGGATRLAYTDLCSEQAFSFDTHTLALQFHIEVRASELERWLVGHVVEIEAAGLDPSELRTQAQRWSEALEANAVRMLDAWIAEVS